MNSVEYENLVKSVIKKDNVFKNVLVAFISGGLIAIIGQLLNSLYLNYFNESDASLMVFNTFIIIGSLLTGLGVFDKVLSICKCGLIVPSTGFANTMTSSAMDYKNEGFVKGIGSNIFKLTGSIILYGTLFGLVFGYIRSIL